MTVASITPIGGSAPFETASQIIFGLVRSQGLDLPAAVFDVVSAGYYSDVDWVEASAEAFYAAALGAAPGAVQDAYAVACVQLADFFTRNAFGDVLGKGDRGLKMAGACRRLVGLGDQAQADDPQPLSQFAPEL